MAGRTPSAPPTRLLSQEPFNVSTHLAKAAFQLSCLRDASGISLFLSVVLGRVPDFKRTWEAEIDTCRSPTLHRLWDVLQPVRMGRPVRTSAGQAVGMHLVHAHPEPAVGRPMRTGCRTFFAYGWARFDALGGHPSAGSRRACDACRPRTGCGASHAYRL